MAGFYHATFRDGASGGCIHIGIHIGPAGARRFADQED